MTSIQRMKVINRAIADGVTDTVEDMVLDGKLTRAEGDEIYCRLANVLSIQDLVPRGRLVLKSKLLKQKFQRELRRDIQNRLSLAVHYPPVHLPGTTRPQEVPDKSNSMLDIMQVKKAKA